MARSGRRSRDRRERSGKVNQRPWRQVENPFPPMEILDADGLEAIEDAALTILEEIGMDFLHPRAHDILRDAGARHEAGTDRVRFDRGLIRESVAKAPSRYTLFARNPAHNLEIGGRWITFGAVSSPPNVSDVAGGRRPGNKRDFDNLVRLGQSLNCVHLFGGYPVEPVDLPPATRHLDCIQSFVRLSDKLYHAYSLGRGRILDGIEMARIARGISEEQFCREPSLTTVINTSSPLRLDGPMIEGMIEMARCNQCIIITPFTLSGAMAPATIAGALAQQHAEALAAIAFAQIVQPGCPVMYGGFTSNVDMKSGAPAFGTPEYAKAVIAGGQLARRIGIPYRTSGVNAANAIDSQAAYEAMMSLWPAIMAHGNMIKHAAGWLEGGLTASFEKMVMDAELLQMMTDFLLPLEVNEDTLGLDAIREVGPGGHFFGTAHTLARFETAFYPPLLSDWRNFETWEEAGRPLTLDHASRVVGELLADYQPPPLDPAIDEELDAFIATRREAGGVAA
ncbi:MAG: trimethylamine methyltransferase family protein [Alphaproteobacteria bacterium]